jgi:carboxyvinyl-carboxyphosphonate phosphorylmutase
MLEEPGVIVIPFVYDALSAKLVERAGFQAVGMTGAGVSASLLGISDVGLISLLESVMVARYMVNAVDIPVFVDADTGYGTAINVMRTVREFERAGVAGLFIEDQVAPKKCGHFAGKQLISRREMILKIEAALEARQDPDLVLMARTDAIAVLGFDEAIERAKDYFEAGADTVFVEAPESVEQLSEIATSLDGPLWANIVEGGKTPQLRVAELANIGYKVVSFSNSVSRTAAKAMQEVLQEIKEKGTTAEFLDRMISFEERNEILGLATIYELEERFLSGDG